MKLIGLFVIGFTNPILTNGQTKKRYGSGSISYFNYYLKGILFILFLSFHTISSFGQKKPENKIVRLSIIGDFDGDLTLDTINQNNISKLTNTNIESYPDGSWDSIVIFFNRMESDIVLTSSNIQIDTLHLGIGKGLYCLINIGDNNNDGKDEVALVIDLCDYSNINSCKIYTIRNKKFVQVFRFGVNENAFECDNWTSHLFVEIPGFLVKENGLWEYCDYDKQEWISDNKLKKYKLKY